MVELVYLDGTTRRVQRCFAVLGPGDDEPTAYVAQRRPGSKLIWLTPTQLSQVLTERPPGQYVPPPPPSSR